MSCLAALSLDALVAASTVCFGDNSGGASLTIPAPDELDGEDTFDFTVTVKSEASAQVPVALNSEAGVLT